MPTTHIKLKDRFHFHVKLWTQIWEAQDYTSVMSPCASEQKLLPFCNLMSIAPTLLLFFLFYPSILSSSSFAPTPPPSSPKFACQPPNHNTHPFCNGSLPIRIRARSLISLLTLQEKVLLLSDSSAPIPRLGIPAYEWWSESLHGVATNGPGVTFRQPIPAATSFPQVILLSSAFNRTLWSKVARAIAVEARAMFNVGLAGATFWAPNVNVFRDPRWGRGQETAGEDPFVCGEYAVEYVLGFQGEDEVERIGSAEEEIRGLREKGAQGEERDGRLMVSACCKHYIAYDLEKWGNFTRYTFNAKVTKQDMEDTYQPPFKSCMQEGRASCLMCSYNEVNGVPVCADRDLLRKTRDEWGFQGYITSDCNAVATIFEYQNYTTSPVDAVALALEAGVDINCGGYYTLYTEPALKTGKIQEDDIDRALLNLFTVQLRLGLFDGNPTEHRFGKFGPYDVCTADHRHLALEAAKQGIVLLKNDKDLLPLRSNGQQQRRERNADVMASLAVIGPLANTAIKLGGDYSGVPCKARSLVDAFQDRLQDVFFAAGCADVQCESTEEFPEAVKLARKTDAVVVVAGLDSTQEDEDLDRMSLLLPGKQGELVAAVASASRRPVVLVLVGGGPMDVSFAEKDSKVGSILWVGYPGEAGSQAVAEVILGDFSPSGRLSMTWYPESFTSIPMNDMHMRPDPSHDYPGRSYRFYVGPVVYNFGHGLSYSKYSEKFLSAPGRIGLSTTSIKLKSAELQRYNGPDNITINKLGESCNALKFAVHVSVTNEGAMDGSHVILLFSRYLRRSKDAPQKQLVGFERVHVPASQSTEATLLLEPCVHLSTADEKGERVLPLGHHVLMLESGAEHSFIIEL